MTHQEIIADLHQKIMTEWDDSTKKEFFLTGLADDTTLDKYHLSLGLWIRNHYNLWTIPWTPEIKEHMGGQCDCSPYHPDAVSMTIIKEVWKMGLVNGNEKSSSST